MHLYSIYHLFVYIQHFFKLYTTRHIYNKRSPHPFHTIISSNPFDSTILIYTVNITSSFVRKAIFVGYLFIKCLLVVLVVVILMLILKITKVGVSSVSRYIISWTHEHSTSANRLDNSNAQSMSILSNHEIKLNDQSTPHRRQQQRHAQHMSLPTAWCGTCFVLLCYFVQPTFGTEVSSSIQGSIVKKSVPLHKDEVKMIRPPLSAAGDDSIGLVEFVQLPPASIVPEVDIDLPEPPVLLLTSAQVIAHGRSLGTDWCGDGKPTSGEHTLPRGSKCTLTTYVTVGAGTLLDLSSETGTGDLAIISGGLVTGLFYVNGGNVKVTDLILEQGKNSYGGAAIYMKAGARVEFTRSIARGCETTSWGGAMYVKEASVLILDEVLLNQTKLQMVVVFMPSLDPKLK